MKTKEATAEGPVKIEIFNPSGGALAGKLPASRLPDLRGKTVCELWDGLFKGDEMLPLIRDLLKKQFPDIKIIPYTEFPKIYPPPPQIGDIVKQKGCNAVISAVGG